MTNSNSTLVIECWDKKLLSSSEIIGKIELKLSDITKRTKDNDEKERRNPLKFSRSAAWEVLPQWYTLNAATTSREDQTPNSDSKNVGELLVSFEVISDEGQNVSSGEYISNNQSSTQTKTRTQAVEEEKDAENKETKKKEGKQERKKKKKYEKKERHEKQAESKKCKKEKEKEAAKSPRKEKLEGKPSLLSPRMKGGSGLRSAKQQHGQEGIPLKEPTTKTKKQEQIEIACTPAQPWDL